jgi:serine/threonine protein kinase
MRCCPGCGAVYREELARCTNDGSELIDTATDPLLGAKIGTYKVDAFIGQGGMGRVYRAHHVLLAHRVCALKVLLGDFAGNAAMRIRFSTEAKHASRLAHPNIASVFDFGRTESGLLYLAMEHVEGTSLEDLVTSEPMEPARVIHLARALCAGLAHAHDTGVIHRDFKPDNVLVMRTPDGEEVPKIVDFGLAIASDNSDSRVTSTGLVMGTPGYIAPEQLVEGDVDHRVDLYALGVTMFELLTGGLLPFGGEPAEVIGRKVASDPPSLATRAKHPLPPGLVAVVDRLIQRKPDRRFADAHELGAALDELARNSALEPARLRSARVDDTVIERAAEPSGALSTQHVRQPRRRWPIALALVGLGGAAVAAVVIATTSRSTESVADVPPQPAPTPPPGPAPDRPPPAEVPSPIVLEHAETAVRDDDPGAEQVPPTVSIRASSRSRTRSKPPEPRVAARASEPPPPIVEPAAPPPVAPVITVSLDGLAVDGSLSSATVRRALDRVLPALRSCRTDVAGVVDVKFSIGESRRATRTNANGISAGVAGCVASAIGAVRTETAPDVGDVQVRVRVAFARRG